MSAHTNKKLLTKSPANDISLHIETVFGKLVNPTDPDIISLDIQDIAWALSRISRFAGHTITAIPYNVAQHSVYVANLINTMLNGKPDFDIPANIQIHLNAINSDNLSLKSISLKGLLHDAHEAFIGDIPSPVKRIPEVKETFALLEMRLDHAIYSKFNLSENSDSEKAVIKFADMVALAVEAYQFMPSRGKLWNLPVISLSTIQTFPVPKSSFDSYKDFISAFETYK